MNGYKAVVGLGLALCSFGLFLAGCGNRQSGSEPVKMTPRLSEAELKAGHKLIADNCSSCHTEGEGGGFSRISQERKTPEGWDMTIARMINFHGLEISADDRRGIVKYLANIQGLAPEETADFRYILERRPNFEEKGHDADLMKMCARCHTYSRVALQRRDKDEWVLLAHMHLGQWPSTEYQMYSRERDWWVDATHEVPEKLAKAYPFSTPEWQAWKDGGSPVMAGVWRVAGYVPGKGGYEGTAKILSPETGGMQVTYDLNYADGAKLSGVTNAMLYTGYEWRGQGQFDGKDVQEVYAVSRDGKEFTGRWFLEAADEEGGALHAARVDGPPKILAVSPEYIKAGGKVQVIISGVGLKGDVSLGAGVKVTPVSSDAQKIIVTAEAGADAVVGAHDVKVGDLKGPALVIYNKVDTVQVSPGYGVARAGGTGGVIPAVTAQYEALGYMNGPDGKPGTADDIRIGVMPAAWSTENRDEMATYMEDAKFAGQISATGRFTPGFAGPNPARKFSGGNAGDLLVVANVKDGAATVTGKGRLIVTVQRWNNPPIR